MGKTGKGLALAFFLILVPHLQSGADTEYPAIRRLDSTDMGFKQYIADVELNRRRLFTRPGESPLWFAELFSVYRYVSVPGDDLFSLAARCNVPYSALATLNRLSSPQMLGEGTALLLPSCPGLFIPAAPRSELEQVLASTRLATREADAVALSLTLEQGAETVYFFPGADFNRTERIFFLNPGFQFPLRTFRLTSAFGNRQSPITGNMHTHHGIDMAAPLGTEVFATAEGIVTEIGEDAVYGKYIIIKHGSKWASLYGHLQRVDTTLRAQVKSSTLIGRVGSTGLSTGPHLHFELRENGIAQDPKKHLFRYGN